MFNNSTVSNFRDTLKDLILECDELLRKREYDVMFKNANDYENGKLAQRLLPDEYYKVRFFDKFINLRYNRRLHKYYAYLENCYPSLKFREYFPSTSSSVESYNNVSRYYFEKDFDTSVSTFILLVFDVINQIKKSPDLLYNLDSSPNIHKLEIC